MRYPVIVEAVIGGILLLARLAGGRRLPLLVHVGAAVSVLTTAAFMTWLRYRGMEVESRDWIMVILAPLMVYLSYSFIHALHAPDTGMAGVTGGKAQAPAIPDLEPWLPAGLATPLSAEEKERAAQVMIWRVCWQLPDKDWDAYSLSADAAQRLFDDRENDHLQRTWGKVSRQESQTLLAWYEARTHAARASGNDADNRIAREILRRAAAGSSEPLVIREY
jgi:hypothetical protein